VVAPSETIPARVTPGWIFEQQGRGDRRGFPVFLHIRAIQEIRG
jgi:hypothetical protein